MKLMIRSQSSKNNPRWFEREKAKILVISDDGNEQYPITVGHDLIVSAMHIAGVRGAHLMAGVQETLRGLEITSRREGT